MATENRQTSTWLPPELLEEVKVLAGLERRTVSMWIRLAVEEAVAKAKAAA
jgi:predicted DNA-binding protein